MIDVSALEAVLKTLKKYGVTEFKNDECFIKLDTDYDATLSPEVAAALESLKKADQVTDEDVLFDPYAGLGENENG